MKEMFALLIAILLVGRGGLEVAQAQQPGMTKYAQSGMAFLKIDVSPRTAAMGGTYGSMSENASDMFSNPAGLAFVEGLDVMTSVNNWLVGSKLYGAAAAYNISGVGTFGLGLVTMDFGEFTRTVPYQGTDPALRNKGYLTEGTFRVTEYAVNLSYARQIATRFYVGGQIKYAKQDLGNITIYDEFVGDNVTIGNNVDNIILDFGTLYYTGFKDLRFGLSFRNFSNQSDYFDQRFELPLTFDFGVAMDVLTLLESTPSNSSLTLAVDAVHPRDYSERLHVGAEYSFLKTVFLRGGYKFNYQDQGLTAGLGVNTGLEALKLRADYAYSAFGKFFNPIHRIAIGIGL